MTRPVTLFTGQWADLPFEEVAKLAAEWGYDGLEIAASGDHLDLARADEDDAYVQSRLDILNKYGLKTFAISNHLAGQAVCDDPIDFRHQAILRPYVWGDGDAEVVALGRRGAGGRVALAALDLDEAEAAGAEGIQHVGGAELRDLGAELHRGAHDRGAFRHADFLAEIGRAHV